MDITSFFLIDNFFEKKNDKKKKPMDVLGGWVL